MSISLATRITAAVDSSLWRFDTMTGARGFLTVSCRLPGAGPPTAPASIFEGITVTKDFVDYWFRFEPVAGVDANRTLFHVLP